MALNESCPMPAAAAIAGVLVGLVCIIVGALTFSTCNGGYSLLFFGVGMLAMAAAAFFVGGVPVTGGASLFGAILVIGGIVILEGVAVGCPFILSVGSWGRGLGPRPLRKKRSERST